MLEVCTEVCALHRDSVRATLRVQAGSSMRLLPVPVLPEWLRRQLRRRRLCRWLRLRELTVTQEDFPPR
jgi:hypothetical protein